MSTFLQNVAPAWAPHFRAVVAEWDYRLAGNALRIEAERPVNPLGTGEQIQFVVHSSEPASAYTLGLAWGIASEKLRRGEPGPRLCRQCGCSQYDCRQCVEKTGQPCHWVAADLCSACVEQEKEATA